MSGEGSPTRRVAHPSGPAPDGWATPRQREALRRGLVAALGEPVEILAWRPLPASSRAAPWRLDVRVAGQPHSFVWQESAADSLEHAALTALADHPLPTPRPWLRDPGWQPVGEAVHGGGLH